MFVAAAYVALQLPVSLPLSTRFGALSTGAVGLFFGGAAAVTVIGLGLGLWVLLRPVERFRSAGSDTGRFGVAGLGLALAVFVFSKLHHGLHAADGPAGALYSVLQTVSYSYIFLRAVELVRCVVWGRDALLGPVALAGYLAPFHMLLSGPIAPYADWVAADRETTPEPSLRRLIASANLIVTGMFFKVVMAESVRLGLFGDVLVTTAQGLGDAAGLTAYLYFDFAGYSLIALGIGLALGVPTPRNFDRPFLASSVTAFWTRWHMSLSLFLRNNVFLPLQLFLARRLGRRAATVVAVVPLALTFCAAGMWHRFSVRLLLWGAGMGLVMGVEKLVRDRLMRGPRFRSGPLLVAWRWLGPVYVLTVVVVGMYFVSHEIFG